MRKNQVEHDSQGTLTSKHLERGVSVSCADHGIVLFDEDTLEYLLHSRIVFRDKDCPKVCKRRRIRLDICIQFHVIEHRVNLFYHYVGLDVPREPLQAWFGRDLQSDDNFVRLRLAEPNGRPRPWLLLAPTSQMTIP